MHIIGEPIIGPSGQVLPLSPGVAAGGLVFLSGQLALREGKLVDGDIIAQTNTTLDGIEALLKTVGLGLRDVVKATVWLTQASDFAGFNVAYTARFGDWRPARSTVISGLALPGALVEIEVVAAER